LSKVPPADRQRVNPYAGLPEAIAAGKLLFDENCAKCHGGDAEGRHGRPSLRSERVENATDGELAWLLRNGSLRKGMPTWSSLPEPERWQLIAFLRSLPRDGPPASAVALP
jgi:mono/diheme cytochrome c family protein